MQSGSLAMAQAIASHVEIAADRAPTEAARVRSEERLRAILDNPATVIFLKDLEGRYVLANHYYNEMLSQGSSVAGGEPLS